jgi:hypothetical protein
VNPNAAAAKMAGIGDFLKGGGEAYIALAME